ncbi:hypothetical protein LR48_Vigan08g086200 [Vigna angularis]|uniref:Uncharacterized protein n=1 Tax=Phaseolus angularis TaxID=3914 RepID=A0A0L9V4P4_PHAAN|nr:hypothetical protein LR48_Vigan08g086200 [Vigna angularis]
MLESNEPKPGQPVKFKNMLWIIKDIKAKGVLEIETPYSRRAMLYAASPGLQCMSLDEFITRMSWPGDQAQVSGGGDTFGAEAMADDDLEEDSDAFEGNSLLQWFDVK